MRRSALLFGVLVLSSCSAGEGGSGDVARRCSAVEEVQGRPLRIAATVAPIADIVQQLASGTATEVAAVVPAGVDSHTFAPTPATARAVADADVLVANGLDLEVPTIDLAVANMRDGSAICELGAETLDETEYLFDRSYPEAAGSPNPHVWLSPPAVAEYASVVAGLLETADPGNASTYRRNHEVFAASVDELDRWIREQTARVPAERRVLLTYHDAYAYFGVEYGWDVVAAVQPASFREPSPRDVAELIEQVRELGVPVVFGSEEYPSPVLAQIADEAGAEYVADLRDDVLPGEPTDPRHSWQGLLRENVSTIVEAMLP